MSETKKRLENYIQRLGRSLQNIPHIRGMDDQEMKKNLRAAGMEMLEEAIALYKKGFSDGVSSYGQRGTFESPTAFRDRLMSAEGLVIPKDKTGNERKEL